MIYIRRLWLGPTLLFTGIVYYYFWRSWRGEYAHSEQYLASLHLDPENYQRRFPVTSYIPFPTDAAKVIPKIQHDFSETSETPEARAVRLSRRDAVKKSFSHAWKGYRKHAWTKDEVQPVSGQWRNSFGGWGATLVDTMDTLWLMGMKSEFEECVREVEKIDFTTNTEETLNVFETTIRYLGGLLAAYDLSEGKYPSLLTKAKELGEVLYMSFDTENHMPLTRWKWSLAVQGRMSDHANAYTLIAELGSLVLEFTRLSQLTKDPKYFDAVQRIAIIMAEHQGNTRIPGLWPTLVDLRSLNFAYNHFTLGGMADSTYEYLPKQYLLLGGTDDLFKDMYIWAMEVSKEKLFFRPLTPTNEDILFSGTTGFDVHGQLTMEATGQHLTCFVGGMMGIASKMFSLPEDLAIARKLVDGCIWSYSSMPSGLMPEVFTLAPCSIGITPNSESTTANAQDDCTWSHDKYLAAVAARHPNKEVADLSPIEAGKWWLKKMSIIPPYTSIPDTRYILRPEAIESVFILYRITGNTTLLDSAWTMFRAIEAATRTKIAHAGISDVRITNSLKFDRMESFWLAETLKYFYLIFEDPEVMSLDDYVLNTEAHPLRRPKAGERVD